MHANYVFCTNAYFAYCYCQTKTQHIHLIKSYEDLRNLNVHLDNGPLERVAGKRCVILPPGTCTDGHSLWSVVWPVGSSTRRLLVRSQQHWMVFVIVHDSRDVWPPLECFQLNIVDSKLFQTDGPWMERITSLSRRRPHPRSWIHWVDVDRSCRCPHASLTGPLAYRTPHFQTIFCI